MSRSFSFSEAAEKNAAKGLMDVPHTGVLHTYTAKELIERFEVLWGAKPRAVALPVTNADGLLFDVVGLSGRSISSTGYKGNLDEFSGVVRAFAREGLDIYLTMDPTLAFQVSPSIQLVDIVGDSSRRLCFGNATSNQIASAILGTGIDLVLDALQELKAMQKKPTLRGIVLDIVNLWPMGGSGNRLELTCFCPSCKAYFNGHPKGEQLIDRFKTFPNPWNLMLSATPTGIDFVDEISANHGPKEIVGFSRLRGFDRSFGEDVPEAVLLRAAESLIAYLNVRHDQTIAAANRIFSEALHDLDKSEDPYVREASSGISRILLVEGASYSWTGGVFLEKMDVERPDGFDEVWLDKGPLTPILKKVRSHIYMSRRSRYFIDAFFDFVASVSDPSAMAMTGIGRKTKLQIDAMLKDRLGKCLACLPNGKASLGTLGAFSNDSARGQQGYVGVALDKTGGDNLIRNIHVLSGNGE